MYTKCPLLKKIRRIKKKEERRKDGRRKGREISTNTLKIADFLEPMLNTNPNYAPDFCKKFTNIS